MIPWGELGVDVVMECTGKFRSRRDAAGHLERGAEKVLISCPAEEVDATIDDSHILRSNTVAPLTSITETEAQRCPSKMELTSNTVFKIPTVAEVNQPPIVNVKKKQWWRSRYLSCI